MANWQRLTDYLIKQGDRVTLTWQELGAIVGGLPPSATNHAAWWSGDRPQTRAWKKAGYTLERFAVGDRVWFVADHSESAPQVRAPSESTIQESATQTLPPSIAASTRSSVDLLLVTCVKTKLDHPAPAKDLYISDGFRKQRAYAERLGVPWYILSAEHGLVASDEWLAPYDRYLPDTPRSYREAWGRWVVARLELLEGSLAGRTVEIHASSEYVARVRAHLVERDAEVLEPLAGLTKGHRLRWYNDHKADVSTAASVEPALDLDQVVIALTDLRFSRTPSALRAEGREVHGMPGLYTWWVDSQGADGLAEGLDVDLSEGLIYAGQTGANSSKIEKGSGATLGSRLLGQHLGGNVRSSTFRRTLMCVLREAGIVSNEAALTVWMERYLRVIPYAVPSSRTLGALEEGVLARLDPPLNLQHMATTPLRVRLKELRKQYER